MHPENPYRAPSSTLRHASDDSGRSRARAIVVGVCTTWSPIVVPVLIKHDVYDVTALAEVALIATLFACAFVAGGFVAGRMAGASAVPSASVVGGFSAGVYVLFSYLGKGSG